jgi:hypothetical protein
MPPKAAEPLPSDEPTRENLPVRIATLAIQTTPAHDAPLAELLRESLPRRMQNA